MSRIVERLRAQKRCQEPLSRSDLVVSDSHAGERVWQRSLSGAYGKFENPFGLGSSPAQTDSSLFVLADHRGPSYLVAISKQTGQTVWKRDRASRLSWSSPVVMSFGGTPQIVCSSAGSVDGYRAADGQLLWSYGEVGGNTAATPLAFGDGCFLVGASPGREDRNLEAARKSNLALRVTRQQEQWVPVVVWRNGQAMTSFGSPMVHQNCAYWISRAAVLHCLDAATGEPHYVERVKQPCWATPLGLGDRGLLLRQRRFDDRACRRPGVPPVVRKPALESGNRRPGVSCQAPAGP